MNRFTLDYAGLKIDCLVEYSWRRTISISIKPGKPVLIKAPKLIPLSIIQKHASEKASWIYQKVNYFQTHETKKVAKEYIKGEKHHFLGKEYSLNITTGSRDVVSLQGNLLQVQTVRPTQRIVRTLVRGWYHEQGVELLYKRYQFACEIFQSVGIIPLSLTYKPMKGKWGTCSHDNHICLNPDLVKTPIECIDYVVYHELCHVRHHNHGPRFHSLMNKMMPDWKKRKRILDGYGIS